MLNFEASLGSLIALALSAIALWAFIDALTRRADAFPAADKLTKPAWLLITGLSFVVLMLFGLGILGFVATVAVLVYHLDVRPAVAALTPRR